jgi:hypothetical protein
MKHTPGPWEADFETYPIMVRSQSETWPLVDELGNEEGRAGVFIANTGDNKANARLIAAAPDLLDALMTVPQGLLWSDDDLWRWHDKARAAIAKATGGEK